METIAGVVKSVGRIGAALLDQLYPPTCLACDGPVARAHALCAGCFARLRPITSPLCPRLGVPFEVSLGPDVLSAEAIADPPPFDRARSAVLYNEIARTIVARLKYSDRPELARFCARLMVGAGRELLGDEPVLVPVPLHRSRQFKRLYNQSAELSREVAKLTGLRVDETLVRRVKATRQQVGLSADARQRNVAGAFRADADLAARLRGRPVLIVDDVITTGATIRALTRTLRAAGAEKVDVLSFARVAIGDDLPDSRVPSI